MLVRRIAEEMQNDEELMAALRRVGALPGKVVTVAADRAKACWSAPAASPPRSTPSSPATCSCTAL